MDKPTKLPSQLCLFSSMGASSIGPDDRLLTEQRPLKGRLMAGSAILRLKETGQ
jgi:hypothetical protein